MSTKSCADLRLFRYHIVLLPRMRTRTKTEMCVWLVQAAEGNSYAVECLSEHTFVFRFFAVKHKSLLWLIRMGSRSLSISENLWHWQWIIFCPKEKCKWFTHQVRVFWHKILTTFFRLLGSFIFKIKVWTTNQTSQPIKVRHHVHLKQLKEQELLLNSLAASFTN